MTHPDELTRLRCDLALVLKARDLDEARLIAAKALTRPPPQRTTEPEAKTILRRRNREVYP